MNKEGGASNINNVNAFAKRYGVTNKVIVEATKNLKAGTIQQDAFNKIVGEGTNKLGQFALGLKNVVANMGIMLAVTLALKAVTFVIDEMFVTFEEQKETVEELTNSVKDLQSEYDTLKADPSTSGIKLTELKKRLEYQKELLSVEKEKLALKDIEENMSDEGVSTTALENTLKTFNNTKKEIERLETEGYGNDRIKDIYAEQYESNVEVLTSQIDSAKEEYIKTSEDIEKLKQYIEDGSLTGVQADNARQLIAEKQAELDRLDPIILQAELEIGTANYLEAYNKILDDIQGKQSHMRSTDYAHVQTVDGEKDLKDVIKVEQLDNIIAKNKELNQSLLEGEVTSKEYLESINKLITDSNLDEAISKVKDWSTEQTDYLEETVTVLSSQVADAMMESAGKFVRDESSVRDYVDDIEEASKAEMKMLKATYRLADAQDDQVVATENSAEGAEEAAEKYNELQEQLEELSSVDGMLDVQTQFADLVEGAENWTADMLDTSEMQNYISEMSVAIADFAQQHENTISEVVTKLSNATGKSIDEQMLLSKNASSYLEGIFGESLSTVQGMNSFVNSEISGTVTNTSNAIGGVLTALGNFIKDFKFTIDAVPLWKGFEKREVDVLGKKLPIVVPKFSLEISGSGTGKSFDNLVNSISNAGSYFNDQGVIEDMINSGDYYGRKGTGGKTINAPATPSSTSSGTGSSGGSGGGSGSSKDPHVAEVDKYKELTDAVEDYDRQLEKLENAYDHTDSVKERIGLKQAEIQIYQKQKDAIDALNKARDVEIGQNVELLRKQGFKITYDPNTEQLIIHNREHINNLSQDIIETYEDLIETTDELNDANKDSADQWLELSYAIVDAGKELTELRIEQYEEYITEQEHLLKLLANRDDALKQDLPIYDNMMDATLKMWQELVDDGYKKNKEKIQELEEEWMDFYDSRIEREKELLENQLDDNDDALDAIIKVIEDEIEAIDDQIDSLKEANDERKKALELQKAQAELDKQRNQKTRHVLRKGQGWIWESDEDAVKEAEENLSDLKYEQQVDKLEKEKEKLEDLKELWEEIPDIKQNEWNEQLMIDKLGADAEEDILDGRKKTYEDFKDDYIDIQQQIKDKTDELEEHTSEAYTKIVREFERLAKLAGMDFNLDNGKSESKTQSSWYVNKDGKAPSQAKVGDIIYTKGGTYRITSKDENGKFKSEKINDKSTNIAENQWGTKISERVIESGEDVVDSVKDIVRTNEDLVDTEKKNILTSENMSKYIEDGNTVIKYNSDVLDDNTDETEDLSDDTEENSEVTEDNTAELRTLNNNLENLEKLPLEELPEDPFEDLDWGSLTDEEYGWAKQMQSAYETALKQGNESFANQILSMLSDLKNGNSEEYIQIGKDALASANANFEYGGKTSTGGGGGSGTEDRIADLKWIQSKVDEDPSKWSDEFKDRLERAIAIEEYGSGTDSYKYNNGYMTTTITSATNEAENYMTADEIKLKYDYEQGNTNNGYDPEKMAETVADRIAEAIEDGADSIWGGFLPKDFDYATEVIKDNEESLKDYNVPTSNKGSSGGRTSGQKAMDDNNVSQSDRDKIAQAQKDYNDAKAKGDTQGMKDAHDRAEAIRNQNGYSGGVDGSENIVTSNKKSAKSTDENTRATDDNTDSNYEASDTNKEVADSNKELSSSNKTLAESNEKLAKSNSSSGSSSGGSSSGKKGSSGSGSGSSGSSSSSSGRVTWSHNDNGNGTYTHSTTLPNGKKVSYTNTSKKAKGGLNLPEDNYIVNEKGDEIVMDKPDEGNWIRINTGGTVIPHEAAENMWNFGANPKMFLSDLLGYDAMKMNQQMVYMGGTGESKTIIENHYHDMHFHDVKDMDGVKQILAGLPAHAEQHCTSRTRSVRTV